MSNPTGVVRAVSPPTSPERARAEEALSYIRDTMESATTFTALSGWGLVAAGGVGLIASWLAWASGSTAPLNIWVPAALIAVACSGFGNALKAKKLKVPMWSGSFRKMVWGLVPALAAGAIMTFALEDAGATSLLPGMWMAVYGAGIAASATFSVRAVRWMGLAILAAGAAALILPQHGLPLLALGFGGIHIGFGLYIIYRHGG